MPGTKGHVAGNLGGGATAVMSDVARTKTAVVGVTLDANTNLLRMRTIT